MTKGRRHARPLRTRVLGSARVTVSVALGVMLLAGGGAYAAYRYDAATADQIMPGVTIAGIEVGEMTRDEAVAAVTQVADTTLGREMEVAAGEDTWHVTAAELGTTAVVEPSVERALALGDDYSWPSRVFRRLFNSSIDQEIDLKFRRDGDDISQFVETVAETVNVDPSDASVDFVNGELVLQKPEVGWALPVKESQRVLRQAVAGQSETVRFRLERLTPEVGRDDLGHTIVVSLSQLQLYLYDGLRLVNTYPVAAGSPEYPTPPGDWTIVNKVENPTWTNPAPDGWGASLPAFIPGGPGNPLGTRALYLDAPGIRIHGTSASYSIGSYASHGCIRMFMTDVEELFDIVPVGTQVHVVS